MTSQGRDAKRNEVILSRAETLLRALGAKMPRSQCRVWHSAFGTRAGGCQTGQDHDDIPESRPVPFCREKEKDRPNGDLGLAIFSLGWPCTGTVPTGERGTSSTLAVILRKTLCPCPLSFLID